MDISKVIVERTDILEEMKVLNKRTRDAVIKETDSEEKAKAYDIGVENTMAMLEMAIGESDRIIYHKNGAYREVRFYQPLTDALKELEESGQIHLAQVREEKN